MFPAKDILSTSSMLTSVYKAPTARMSLIAATTSATGSTPKPWPTCVPMLAQLVKEMSRRFLRLWEAFGKGESTTARGSFRVLLETWNVPGGCKGMLLRPRMMLNVSAYLSSFYPFRV